MPNSMVFKPPFYEFQSEIYSLFTKADEMNFSIYDSGLSIQEILNDLKNMSSVKYGIIADVTGSQASAKVDSIIWQMSVRIELFSNYKGRKPIAEMINTITAVATQYIDAFSANLISKGYQVVRMSVGESAIGSAIGDGSLVWQNGYITLNYFLAQLED